MDCDKKCIFTIADKANFEALVNARTFHILIYSLPFSHVQRLAPCLELTNKL